MAHGASCVLRTRLQQAETAALNVDHRLIISTDVDHRTNELTPTDCVFRSWSRERASKLGWSAGKAHACGLATTLSAIISCISGGLRAKCLPF